MVTDEAAAAFGQRADVRYYSEYILKWRDIYENSPPWKNVKKGGLFKHGDKRERARLGMAKVLCESFSALTFSEQVEISVNDGKAQKFVEDTLNGSGFWKKLPELLCSAYALGGGAVKCYIDEGRVKLDYVTADRFIPTKWDGRGITEGIFCGCERAGEWVYTLTEYQHGGMSDFKLFKSKTDGQLGSEVPLSELYPDLPAHIDYNADTPLFAYFRPFVANNADYDTPLGMSIFEGCLDTLRSLDIVYDSLQREFTLGKKRIIVPVDCIRAVMNAETGEMERHFDADDEAFVALESGDSENLKITDNTMELRVEPHVSAINAYLNILCMQTGLSAGTFSFDVQQGMKTATEIISQESKTARTIKNNKNILGEAIEGIVRGVLALAVYSGSLPTRDYDVVVGWKDNIIIDDNTLIDNNIKLVSAGLKSKTAAIMEVLKCDEKTAKKELSRISEETAVSGMGADSFGFNEDKGNDDN